MANITENLYFSHLGVGFQFSRVGDTSLVPCEGETVVDEVEFVGGAENRT